MTYKTICRCDHDMATHYKETFPTDGSQEGKRGACLARGCECRTYRDALDPSSATVAPKYPKINTPAPDSFGYINDPQPKQTDPPATPRTTWPYWP